MAILDNRSLLELAQRYSQPGIALQVKIEGLAPGFLMHSPKAMRLHADAEKAWREGGKRSKFVPEQKDEAEWGTYRMLDGAESDKGDLCLPHHVIHRCLVEAAKAFKVPKSRSNLSKPMAAGLKIPIEAGWGVPLINPDTDKPIEEYEVYPARVNISRQAVIKARPLVMPWAARFVFDLDTDAVPIEMFAQIVGYAGHRQGVGDWRPEKNGRFGCFGVAEFEVI